MPIICLSQEKQTADAIAGNESNVCRNMGHQQLMQTQVDSDTAIPTC